MLEKNGDSLYKSYMMQSTLVSILVRLNRDIQDSYQSQFIKSSKSNSYVQQALDYINEHLADNILIDEIAHHININKHYLCHLFKSSTGTTIQGYISTRRLYQAKELLTTTDYSMQEIALRVGYCGYSSFSQAFKRQFGVSPKKHQMLLK